MSETDPAPPLDLLPREEALERLGALVQRLSVTSASRLPPRTESERHRLEHGHKLAYGCCRADLAR